MLHEKCRNPAELVLVHILVRPQPLRPFPLSHIPGAALAKNEGAWEVLAAAGPQRLSGLLNTSNAQPKTPGW